MKERKWGQGFYEALSPVERGTRRGGCGHAKKFHHKPHLFVKPFAGLRGRFLALQALRYGKADDADEHAAAKAQEYQDEWGDGHG